MNKSEEFKNSQELRGPQKGIPFWDFFLEIIGKLLKFVWPIFGAPGGPLVPPGAPCGPMVAMVAMVSMVSMVPMVSGEDPVKTSRVRLV